MKALKKIGIILIYVLLVLILFYQVMGIWGVAISDVTALKEATWLIPAWIVMVALIAVALVLRKAWKDKENLPLISMGAGLIGAVLALVIALTLQAALPMQMSASNVSTTGQQGLDAWKLITRHYSPVAVGVVIAVMSFVAHKQARDQRINRENNAYEEQFTAEGDEYITPDDHLSRTGGKKSGKKLSKKQRKALKNKGN